MKCLNIRRVLSLLLIFVVLFVIGCNRDSKKTMIFGKGHGGDKNLKIQLRVNVAELDNLKLCIKLESIGKESLIIYVDRYLDGSQADIDFIFMGFKDKDGDVFIGAYQNNSFWMSAGSNMVGPGHTKPNRYKDIKDCSYEYAVLHPGYSLEWSIPLSDIYFHKSQPDVKSVVLTPGIYFIRCYYAPKEDDLSKFTDEIPTPIPPKYLPDIKHDRYTLRSNLVCLRRLKSGRWVYLDTEKWYPVYYKLVEQTFKDNDYMKALFK